MFTQQCIEERQSSLVHYSESSKACRFSMGDVTVKVLGYERIVKKVRLKRRVDDG